MKTIHKFVLNARKNVHIFPKGHKVLSFGMQHDDIVLWVLLDDSLPNTEERVFEVYGTGWEVDDRNSEFCGTVQNQDGLVFHVFENR